jgi:hypothetical protein
VPHRWRAHLPIFGKKPPAGPEKASEVYTGLRSTWFRPELMQGDPASPGSIEPIAVLFEMGTPEGTATFTAADDGATSMYLSNGGGSINNGSHPAAAAAALAFVGCAASYAWRFPRATSVPPPGHQGYDIHIITPAGLRSAHFPTEASLEDPEFEPLKVASDHLANTTMLLDGERGKGPRPIAMIAHVLPDGGVRLYCKPSPVPTWLTAKELGRALTVAKDRGASLEVDLEPGDARLQEPVLAAIDRAGYARNARSGTPPPRLKGTTTLHWAVMFARLDIVRDMAGRGADLEARDDEQCTPLLRAALFNRASIVEALLDAGADMRAKDPNANTVLHFLVQSGDLAAVKRLVDAGADLHARGEKGYTPLAAARVCKQREVEAFLRSRGARE